MSEFDDLFDSYDELNAECDAFEIHNLTIITQTEKALFIKTKLGEAWIPKTTIIDSTDNWVMCEGWFEPEWHNTDIDKIEGDFV